MIPIKDEEAEAPSRQLTPRVNHVTQLRLGLDRLASEATLAATWDAGDRDLDKNGLRRSRLGKGEGSSGDIFCLPFYFSPHKIQW